FWVTSELLVWSAVWSPAWTDCSPPLSEPLSYSSQPHDWPSLFQSSSPDGFETWFWLACCDWSSRLSWNTPALASLPLPCAFEVLVPSSQPLFESWQPQD